MIKVRWVAARGCQIGSGPALAARSPGVDNAENLRESLSLSRRWDFGGETGDDCDVHIECRDVHKSFGDKHVFRGLSFKIRHGEAVGIIGPSGTGKSTILKVFRTATLFDSLTVRENVGFLLYENSNLPEDQVAELVKETLDAVGLKGVEDLMPSKLSSGMKKRVALACSIIFDDTKEVTEPEVLLYDEHTAGLDPIAFTVIVDLIRSMHMTGKDALGKLGKIASYVVVTHQHSTI